MLAGPTGSGKSDIASSLDKEIFEIVVFDSRQVYKELGIGTSKPGIQEVRLIQHHLIDFLSPSEKLNAREFCQLARQAVNEVFTRNRIPVIVAGTGFYLKAFLYGMFQVPETDLKHRNELQNLSREERWTLLREKDIASANKLSINDDYRVIRALEVMKSGVLWSSLQENRSEGFLSEPGVVIKGLFLNRNRQDLYERINKRARFMIENGMIEETKLVMEKFGESCPGLSSLGYNFALDLIKGRMSIDTFYEKLSQSHRNYAKKQITWFNKENILVPVSPNDALEHMKNI